MISTLFLSVWVVVEITKNQHFFLFSLFSLPHHSLPTKTNFVAIIFHGNDFWILFWSNFFPFFFFFLYKFAMTKITCFFHHLLTQPFTQLHHHESNKKQKCSTFTIATFCVLKTSKNTKIIMLCKISKNTNLKSKSPINNHLNMDLARTMNWRK